MSEIVIYEDGSIKLEVALEKDSIWLTQEQIAELFDVKRPAITKHLSNIFKSKELDENMVCSILEHTTQHGAIASFFSTTNGYFRAYSKRYYYQIDRKYAL